MLHAQVLRLCKSVYLGMPCFVDSGSFSVGYTDFYKQHVHREDTFCPSIRIPHLG